MLWLYIVLAILLLIFLLMLVPVGIRASYTDSFRCVLTVGFIRFTVYPQKAHKKKKPSPTKTENKQPKEPVKKKNLIKEKGISWLFDVIKKVANLAGGALKDFFKHIIVKKLMLSITVAGDDAADTAVKYGGCCSAVYPAFGIVVSSVKCKSCGVDISPNFDEKASSSANLELEASIRAMWLAYLVIKHGYKGIKLLVDLKN